MSDRDIYKTQKICRSCKKWKHAYDNGYKVVGICKEDLMKAIIVQNPEADHSKVTVFTPSMFGCVYHQFRERNNSGPLVVCVIPDPKV